MVHELGHFVTARIFKVKVEEFGLGFPPRLLSFKRGETVYSLNATPLGGFVKLAGENDPAVTRSLASKGAVPRIIILSAGSLMNILLPIVLFSIAFMIPHDQVISEVRIRGIVANSPAAMAGMTPGDTVLEVNGNPVRNNNDIHRAIQLNLGKPIALRVQHADSTTETIEVTPRWKPPAGEGAVGVQLEMVNPTVVKESFPVWQAVPMSFRVGVETLVLFRNGIIGMVIGSTPVELAGPVGIAQITGQAARAGISTLLEFAAFLSINLAIINIFPLPALDGGRVAFVLLEVVRRGKRVSPRTEGIVHLVGFIVLISLVMLITYQDILRISGGVSLLP